MTNEYPAGEMEVRGQTFALRVDDYGRWLADIGEETYGAETRDGLYRRLMDETKRKATPVSIPFVQLVGNRRFGDRKVQHATATGIHAGNHSILVRWADGGRGQIQGYGHLDYLSPLTPEEEAEWIRLDEEMEAARNALAKFANAHKIDLREAIRKTLDAAVKEEASL